MGGLPVGARDALDVGCGEGMLTRRLAEQMGHVVGIDRDAASIRAARAAPGSTSIDYVLGDFATHPFAPESFDVIVAVAALHHMEAPAALARMRGLLRPGGVHPSPQLPPSIGYREVRRLARDLLPGCRYRRHLMWRYSIRWTKPATSPEQGA